MEALDDWCAEPHKFGHLLGFTKLEQVHDKWIYEFLRHGKGETRVLQAHRGSYKTTCGLVALTLMFMINPNARVMIVRKSETMAKKLISAMEKIFRSQIVKAWMRAAYGVNTLETDKWSASALRLSINTRITPEPSLTATGIRTVQTGDHYDFIWSDDIITPDDRYSKAARDETKNYVYETENIIEPDGIRIFTGTVWHPQDAWTVIMPMVSKKPLIYPIGTVPIKEINDEWIARKKTSMPVSLWAANYELKHIKDVAQEFADFIEGEPLTELPRYWYIDPAFGGDDCTAIWEGCTDGEFIYLTWAAMYRDSIASKFDEIEAQFWARGVTKIFYEDSGAQRLVGPEFERRGIPSEGKASNKNKYARITAALKPAWHIMRFSKVLIDSMSRITEGGPEQPPNPMIELMEYNASADHDDSPDACAGLVTVLQSINDINYDDLLDIQRQIS
jgi:hypothetical protein